MPKNRVIYQTEALYVSKTATSDQWERTAHNYNISQLYRVQSCNIGYTLARRDVNQFGELAAIDRIILDSPTINLDFSYLSSTFANEVALGFNVVSGIGSTIETSAITSILAKVSDEKNYFIKTNPNGVDADGSYANDSTVSFLNVGNGFVTNYTAEGSVGDFPRVTCQVEALNCVFDTSRTNSTSGVSGTINPTDSLWITGTGGLGIPAGYNNSGCVVINPAVNPADGTPVVGQYSGLCPLPPATTNPGALTTGSFSVSALRPGDITFDFSSTDPATAGVTALQEGGATISDAKIQSYSLQVALSRDPLQKLGSKYAFAREIRFPVTVSLRVDANVGDITTGNLSDMVTNDKNYYVRIKLKNPTGVFNSMAYTLKQAKLESQSFSSSIGPNKTVTLNFTAQIGGPNQTTVGLFFSGQNGNT